VPDLRRPRAARVSKTPSDAYFACVADDDMTPEMAIGGLRPEPEQAAAVSLLSGSSATRSRAPAGDWRRRFWWSPITSCRYGGDLVRDRVRQDAQLCETYRDAGHAGVPPRRGVSADLSADENGAGCGNRHAVL